MPDPLPIEDTDFSAQMQALVIEAAQAREEKAQEEKTLKDKKSQAELPSTIPSLALIQLLRPIMAGMETVMRAQNAQSHALERLEKAMVAQACVPEMLNDAARSLDQRNVVNRAMFDALHAELKHYKDDFLLESVIRPVIRDLITLHDDTRELLRQAAATRSQNNDASDGFFENLTKNLEHHIHHILEVLERMEVHLIPEQPGKLDKRAHRVIAREPAESEEEDLQIVRSVRPGFSWRQKVVRPEEVVIKKWGISATAHGDGAMPEPDTA